MEIEPLIATAVSRGGHVRIGLEDAPLDSSQSNRELVERARRKIIGAGGTLPTPAQVRKALAAA